jgi:major membrane immunogen (membrane-anchored lipoprotein)
MKQINYIFLRRVTMKKFKVLALVMVLVLTVGMLAACGTKTEPVTTPEPTPAPAPVVEPTPAPAEPAGMKDGIYKATQDKADQYGWKGFVEVEVKDGKIAAVKFDYDNNGALKSQDAAYKAQMEPVSKTYPEKAFAELQTALVEKQDITAVTAVAGATMSSNDFIALVKLALEQAK